MKERDRGKNRFQKEKNNQDHILKSMTEEERDQYFDQLRRKRREKRMKKQKQERRKKLEMCIRDSFWSCLCNRCVSDHRYGCAVLALDKEKELFSFSASEAQSSAYGKYLFSWCAFFDRRNGIGNRDHCV